MHFKNKFRNLKRGLTALASICILLTCSKVYAQQDAQFSQYMFNGLYLNPGYSGIEGVTRFTLINRVQWLGYSPTEGGGSAPNSTILSGTTKLPGKWGGVGLYLLYDRLGPMVNTDIQISYSYHLKVKNGTLGIGAKTGIFMQRLNNKYRVVDVDDPIYQYFNQQGFVSQTKPDVGLGLWYTKKKYYAGVSFNHIPSAKYSFGNKESIESKLVKHLYITGGYNILLGNILLTPSTLIQTDLREVTYLLGALATYNNKFWVGLNARQSFAKREETKGGKTLSNDDIILYVGVNVLKNKLGNDAVRIGYSFDFVTSGVTAKKRTSHELLVSYMAPIPWAEPKPKVRTPRYRHEEN